MSYRLLFASVTLSLAAALPAMGQEVRVYRNGEMVDPQDVARILDRSQPAKSRSIRLLDDGPAVQHATAGGTAGASTDGQAPSALALPVQFSFDSAEILPEARGQLDALAEGIRRLPPQQSVVIEGHTDATGPERYNDQLSLKRAHAVKSYLVATHGIDPARLETVGLGEHATLPGLEPAAAENRRVQFRGE